MTMLSSIILILCITTIHSQKGPVIYKCDDYSECDQVGSINNAKVECSAGKSCESTRITATGDRSYVKCSGRESCKNTMGIGIQVDKLLSCSGYKSCEYATALQAEVAECAGLESCAHVPQITTDTDIYCGGQASCYNSGLLPAAKTICEGFESCKQSTIVSGNDVHCNGEKSCSQATITSPGTVMCLGMYSCLDAAMIRADVAVQLYGVYAANGATIIDTPLIEGYGDTVLKNSIIDSGSLVFVTVKLYGFTAYKSKNPNVFICRAGAECNLYCIGSGCKGLEFRCLPGSTCNIHPSQCEMSPGETIDGTICPSTTDGTMTPEINEDDDDYRVEFGVRINDGEKEYVSDEGLIMTEANVECNLAQECVGQTIGLRSDPIIQCGGYGSCDAAKLSLRYGGMSEIRCQGENSCLFGEMTATNGRILCDGQSSCNTASQIRAQGINCYGMESCQQATMGLIEGGSLPYIECRGTLSCRSAEIMNRFGTTYCTGNGGCYGAVMHSDIYDTQCLGHHACSETDLTTNGGVMCNGDIACNAMRVNFTSDVDYFVANGYLGAHQAKIYASYGTNILGMGYKSLAYSTIDSDDSTLVKVNLYGHLAGYFATYICRSGCECHLTCRGEACKDMDFQCEAGATCFVEPAGCDSVESVAGVICPFFNSNVRSEDIEELMEKKVALRQEDLAWKQIQNEITVNMARFGMARVIDEVKAKQSEQDEEVLLFGDIEVGDVKTVSQGGLVLMDTVGVVFIISLVYLWYRLKVKGKGEYKVILK